MCAMIQTRQDDASAVTAHPLLFESIAALAQRASIETSAKNLVEIDAYPAMIPAGTDVYVAWVPGFPYHHLVSVAKRLRRAGLNPVPHIAARQLASESAAMDFLARLRDEAAVTRALVIAGDSSARTGPYESSLALMRTGLLQQHGIRSIGIAGYPEGHRKIGTAALEQALEGKIDYAGREGIELFIVSQFCFDGQAIVDWIERLRARGVTLPLRVGVAGPATVRTLLGYAMRCGIGNSIRALGSQAISLTRMLARQGPEKIIRRIACSQAGLNIAGLHFFAFGGFAQSARWIANTAAGRFQLVEPDESFSINSDDCANHQQ
jgi:methylenetetrahydrofolate reductase (NADPH)